MAAHGWRTDTPLDQSLREEPWRFEFHQALRLLELLSPEADRLAEGDRPDKEPVRLKGSVSFDFPASDISRIEDGDTDQPPSAMIHVLGLAGALGPLPAPYTDWILERVRKKDRAFMAFLDLFNHRLASILYRIRKIYRPGFEWASPETSPLAKVLTAFTGMKTVGLQKRMRIPDRSLLYYAGILFQRPRSMAGLEIIISHYFGIPCKGTQLVGGWLRLASDQETRIGVTGENSSLGQTTVIGTRVWDQQQGIRLCLGPMQLVDFISFLPDEPAEIALKELIRFYAGEFISFGLELVLSAEEVPRSSLAAEPSCRPRLGRTSWISDGRERAEPGIVRLAASS